MNPCLPLCQESFMYPEPIPPAADSLHGPVRRVLMVSYHFPPVGGAGVQRPLKFVKYLPQYDWEASVLMAANPSVPVLDESLCADLPDDLIVARARTWEPGYALKKQVAQTASASTGPRGWLGRLRSWPNSLLRKLAHIALQPDPQILWLPNAYRAGCELLGQLSHAAILATAPSYTNLLVGVLLKQKFGLPLIVDFRDEWDLSSQYLENSQRDCVSHLVQQRMQRWVLRHADVIIATTQASTERLLSRARECGSRAVAHCIYNGFDTSDFPDHSPATTAPVSNGKSSRNSSDGNSTSQGDTGSNHSETSPRRYHLVYTGTLWNLTTIEPVVQAIEVLQQRVPELLNRLEFTVVGRKTPEQRGILKRLQQTACVVHDRDYCEHREALSLMREADGLCLLLSDVPGADRVAPAKLFEYLATGTPILAVTPEGETAGIVREFFPHSHFLPGNVAGMAHWLEQRLREVDTRQRPVAERRRAPGVLAYSRQAQAGQLAGVLNALLEQAMHQGKPYGTVLTSS